MYVLPRSTFCAMFVNGNDSCVYPTVNIVNSVTEIRFHLQVDAYPGSNLSKNRTVFVLFTMGVSRFETLLKLYYLQTKLYFYLIHCYIV